MAENLFEFRCANRDGQNATLTGIILPERKALQREAFGECGEVALTRWAVEPLVRIRCAIAYATLTGFEPVLPP